MKDNNFAVCGAKTRSDGVCQKPPLNGATRCKLHGGATPRGVASPQFKHGRYSKDLPTKLAARFQEAQSDPKLLELRDEVALLDSRIAELLEKLPTGESQSNWADAQEVFKQLQSALTLGDAPGVKNSMGAMAQIFARTDDSEVWQEVYSCIEQRRKLVESERKHMVQMEQLLTLSEVMTLGSALLASVKAHVQDRDALASISTEFSRLMEVQE